MKFLGWMRRLKDQRIVPRFFIFLRFQMICVLLLLDNQINPNFLEKLPILINKFFFFAI